MRINLTFEHFHCPKETEENLEMEGPSYFEFSHLEDEGYVYTCKRCEDMIYVTYEAGDPKLDEMNDLLQKYSKE